MIDYSNRNIADSPEQLNKSNKPEEALYKLTNKKWLSGALNCNQDLSDKVEVYQYDLNSYILRQNKCTHYEAPFMYLLFSDDSALLIDTGATQESDKFPLAKTISEIIENRALQLNEDSSKLKLTVVHSHGHSDHTAGDKQFENLSWANIIPANNIGALTHTFSLKDWPNKYASYYLGNRELIIIPSPGHKDDAISIYDTINNWLITGDNIYPGRLYIQDWRVYCETISRLFRFSEQYKISAILGSHIEMSSIENKDYPAGCTFQPDETSLVLTINDLHKLNSALEKMNGSPKQKKLGNMIIYPLNQAS